MKNRYGLRKLLLVAPFLFLIFSQSLFAGEYQDLLDETKGEMDELLITSAKLGDTWDVSYAI